VVCQSRRDKSWLYVPCKSQSEVHLTNAVVPSNMNPMGTGSGADIFGDLVSKVPAERAGGLEDLAGVVLFLVSKAGSYVDGWSIAVDGGRTLFANGQV
jgi:NAD(P)-dependent dehydrogenase (short-subunit alcohol dehydrogenase family)